MSEAITGVMPIRTPHRRFIEWRENLNAGESLDLTRNTPICLFITAQLRMGLSLMDWPRKCPDVEFPEVVEHYEDQMPFSLTGKLAHFDVFHLLPLVARRLEEFIPSIMHEEVCARVHVAHGMGLSEKLIIQEFMQEANLMDGIEFDTIKRQQQRFRSARSYLAYMRGGGKWKKRR